MKNQYLIKGLGIIFTLIIISNCTAVQLSRTEEAKSRQQQIQTLIQKLKGEKYIRDQAREAIIKIGSPAIPSLAEVLKNNDDFTLSWEAVNIMGYIGDKEAAPILIEQVLNADNNHVRWRSIWALTQIKDERIVVELLKALKDEKERIRWNAAVALSNMDCKEAVPVLRRGLKSHSDWIRWEAVNALGRVHDEDIVMELIPLLKDPDKRIKQETILSLGRIGDKRATTPLLEMLVDTSPDIRWRAAMALGMIGDEKAIKGLEKQLKTEKDVYVKESIEEALQNI
jgi:HEAT repeat protein